jgi:hypothetical protein
LKGQARRSSELDKGGIMRRSIALVFVAALALAAASGAGAGKPVVTFPPFPGFTDTALCGFPIEFSFEGTVKDILFLDQNGVPKREIQTFGHFIVTFTHGSKSLSTNGPAGTMITFDAAGQVETVVIHGLNAAISIPGQGLIALDAGRIVLFDATGKLKPESGFHVFFGTADKSKFCAAMA